VILWIVGVYLFFNRKNRGSKLEGEHQYQFDIIAVPNESTIRVVFDRSDPGNIDIKSLNDLTVKYSEIISGNYKLPVKEGKQAKDELTEKKTVNDSGDQVQEQEEERAENMDLSDYVNILSIKKLNNQ
jgi:hypothetical protein